MNSKEEQFYYLLGLFAGDGWFQSRGISIGTSKKKRSEEIAKIMQTVFLKKPIIKRRRHSDGHVMYYISVYSVEIEKELRLLLGGVKRNKSRNFIPPDMKNKDLARAFIEGLFDAESYEYVWKNKPRIGFGIYNEKASRFVFKNLREDKIKATLSKCKDGCFRIDITGKDNVDRYHSLYAGHGGKP